jgi:hypothetical protein
MARYSLGYTSKVMIATADGAPMTSNGYAAFLQGGNGTMQIKVNEVYVAGESAASNPTTMAFGRDSTVGVTAITATGNQNALLDGSGTAPATIAVFGSGATTNPSRSATLGRLLSPTLNGFGGIARWQARYGEEITMIGNTASLGEVSLSAVTGTGQLSGHILYELV